MSRADMRYYAKRIVLLDPERAVRKEYCHFGKQSQRLVEIEESISLGINRAVKRVRRTVRQR